RVAPPKPRPKPPPTPRTRAASNPWARPRAPAPGAAFRSPVGPRSRARMRPGPRPGSTPGSTPPPIPVARAPVGRVAEARGGPAASFHSPQHPYSPRHSHHPHSPRGLQSAHRPHSARVLRRPRTPRDPCGGCGWWWRTTGGRSRDLLGSGTGGRARGGAGGARGGGGGGRAFSGFARQRDRRTVQGELEAALGRVVKGPVVTVGAGRTDAGVHARGQGVHADVPAGGGPRRGGGGAQR